MLQQILQLKLEDASDARAPTVRQLPSLAAAVLVQHQKCFTKCGAICDSLVHATPL